MERTTLIEEKVYSPIEDVQIKSRTNLNNALIWKNCFKEEEVADFEKGYTKMFCYTIKFNGLVPVQLTKMERIK